MSNTKPAGDQKKTNSGLSALIWWKTDPEELEKQVAQYTSLGIWRSARGISMLCCVFSVLVTVLLGRFLKLSVGTIFAEALMWSGLATCMYRGQRWAFVASMLLWTVEKGATVFTAASAGGAPIVQVFWWAGYMKAFFLGFKVEQRRRAVPGVAPASEKGEAADTHPPQLDVTPRVAGEAGVPPVQPSIGSPTTPLVSRVRSWVGALHGGQLVMLLLLAIPTSLIGGVAGLIGVSAASSGSDQIARGRYSEAPSFVEIGGTTYEMARPLAPAYISYLRAWADTQKMKGMLDYQISEGFKNAKLPIEVAYVSDRASLEAKADEGYWAWPLVLVSSGLVVFSFWSVWVWLGARSRSRKDAAA